MSHEVYIKRTIYEAKCSCGKFEDHVASNPPRERQCPCRNEWVSYKENTAFGREYLTENRR